MPNRIVKFKQFTEAVKRLGPPKDNESDAIQSVRKTAACDLPPEFKLATCEAVLAVLNGKAKTETPKA